MMNETIAESIAKNSRDIRSAWLESAILEEFGKYKPSDIKVFLFKDGSKIIFEGDDIYLKYEKRTDETT